MLKCVKMATTIPKIRHRVRALDEQPPWCIPLPEGSTVADLARAVEIRENQVLQGGEAEVTVGIQLEFRDEVYAVSPVDLLVDHVPTDSKDAMFVAVRKGGESSASSLISGEEAPSMAAAAAPALVGGGTGPESFRRQPHVSPSFTAVISPTIARVPRSETAPSGGPKGSDVGAACAGVDEVAGGGSGSSVAPASEGEASSSGCSSGSCDACNSVLSIATPTFCCRVCSKLFHSECVGYNTFAKRQSPPPDWICPRCPNGERGPSEGIHRSLKGDGVVKQQRGNQPWCPICLGDDRVPGTGKMGRSSKTKCRGCGLRTHDHCLPKHEIGPDGRWPCNECQRRRDGVVPGNNPVWLRLKEARLDGGWDVSVVPDAAATSAQSAVQGTGAAAAPSLDQTKGLDHHEPGSNSADRRGTPEVNRSRRSITPGRRASSDSTTSCCKAPATPKRPAFCCRVCRKLFHGVCAGYNSKKRQVPPPDWICPHCPNGERGPSETIHRSLKGKGVVNQKLGNMPWCPICLSDNRISGKKEIGDIERCPGCGFHTHAHCLAGLQVWQDGRWPCDECDRRRHGVVPGNNPDWLRLRAARLDGGRKPTWTHLPPAVETACATPPAAATADSPHSDVASCLEDSARPSANEQAETETAAGLCESIKGRPSLHHHLDHVQIQRSHDTVLGSHEMAATGAVGGVLPAAAAEAATERAVFHCPPAGSPFSDQMQFFDGLAPSSAVTLAVREAARAAEAAAADAPAPRDSLLGLAPSSGRVLAAPGTTPPPKPAESCAQSVGSPDLDHMLFLGSLGLPRANPAGTPAALAATPAAGARTPAGVPSKAVGATASLPPHSDSTEALEARRAAPPGVAESCRLVFGVPNIQEVFLASGLAQSSADASAATTPSALRAIDPYNSTAGTTSPSDHQHQPEPNDSTSSGGQETTAVTETTAETGSEEAEGGAEGKEMEPEQTFPSPRPAEESSRGASSDGSDNSTHNSCEVCNKVFIPSLRPTFSCRACRKLFHGDCAGYARHKRQCPPPDWICPRCPNGERGPTEYDIHSSLRGRGTVSQTLGNQLWCPICLGDDRARGSTKNDTDGKKCPDCGLRVHGHCVSGLEAGPDGRWPCDECLRRRNGVTPGNNPLWLRLKAARLDGGPTVANIGVTLSPAGAVVSAAASTGSPLSRGGSSCGSVERRAYSRQAAAAGAVRPLVANASSPSPDSSQASSLGGPLTSSGDSAGVPTTAPSTCSPSPPSPSRQPVLPLALPASHSSPASSPGEAMQLSAPASSNAQATPSRADTTEHSDIIGDDEVALSDGSDQQGAADNQQGSSATVSQPASKKARLAGTRTGQLQPRSAIRSKGKVRDSGKRADTSARSVLESSPEAAETIAVAAAQLLGGMPDQQSEAEAFVETELANHNTDLCNRLTERLKRAVDVNEGGVWVNRTAVADLCGSSKAPTGFPCVVRYVVGPDCPKNAKESRQEARACFSQVLTRAHGSGGAFESYNIGGETMLRWKGGPSS